MKLGYSFWGFLGAGVTDTPDGGRSHRRPLVDGLQARGHDIVFLQLNRDLVDAGLDLTTHYRWDQGLPAIDALFLEWRWPIPGRNTTPCGTSGHTCDLHRQDQLVGHYTGTGTPTIIWDKDRTLPGADPIRGIPYVTVCEAAFNPTPGAVTLLFPVADELLENADPSTLASLPRNLPLVYIGNQYRRDLAFSTLFAPAAARVTHVVAGKWTDIGRWPHVSFIGRVPFPEVAALYRRAIATVLLLPDDYQQVGQVTQRIFEATLSGCVPLTPVTIRGVDRVAPWDVQVATSEDVVAKVDRLARIMGTAEHAQLLAAYIAKLQVFRLSTQLRVLDRVLAGQISV